jgi:hypothetical protein
VRFAARILSLAALIAWVATAQAVAAADIDMGPDNEVEDPVAFDTDRIAEHLKARLTDELLGNFALFIYVDKATAGPFAQRMFVFKKTADGNFAPLYDWPVSTGRETIETDALGDIESTSTPRGFYELDPHRFYTNYTSTEWAEPMPYAMFFNWRPDGHETGLAIHGVEGAAADRLGERASAGCVHLSLENAQALHDLIQTQFEGQEPALQYRDETGDISSDGWLVHEPDGTLRFESGYSVLVLVDDFGDDHEAG